MLSGQSDFDIALGPLALWLESTASARVTGESAVTATVNGAASIKHHSSWQRDMVTRKLLVVSEFFREPSRHGVIGCFLALLVSPVGRKQRRRSP